MYYPSLPLSVICSYPSFQVSPVSKVSYDSPRYKLTPERAIPLIKWFEEHKEHPYPSRHEKMVLCQSTQLTFTQVCKSRFTVRPACKHIQHNIAHTDSLCAFVTRIIIMYLFLLQWKTINDHLSPLL